jgi:hypothetical protein
MKGKKSLEYRLQCALRIAQLDPNASVIYATGSVEKANDVWHTLINLVGKPNGFSYRLIQREARHDGGGFFKVLPVCEPYWHYGGWQMSHLWLDETLSRAGREAISSRHRSAKEHNYEPPGIYDEYGVTRRMDY